MNPYQIFLIQNAELKIEATKKKKHDDIIFSCENPITDSSSMIAKTEKIFLPISSCFVHFCDRHLESAIFIYESSWQIRNQHSQNLFEYILTFFLVNFNLDHSFFFKMGKFNICIILLERNSTMVAKPTIETSQIDNFQYRVPFSCIFWKESRTSNARTPKVFFQHSYQLVMFKLLIIKSSWFLCRNTCRP